MLLMCRSRGILTHIGDYPPITLYLPHLSEWWQFHHLRFMTFELFLHVSKLEMEIPLGKSEKQSLTFLSSYQLDLKKKLCRWGWFSICVLILKELSLAGGYTTAGCLWIASEGKENSKRKKRREKEGRSKSNCKILSAFQFFFHAKLIGQAQY